MNKKTHIMVFFILIILMINIFIPRYDYAAEIIVNVGDINEDGIVDSRDTTKILQHIAASKIPKIAQKHPDWILRNTSLKAGDVNEDGIIDSRDTTRVLQHIAASKIPKIAQNHPDWKSYIESKWKAKAQEIKLDKTNITIKKGEIFKLIAKISPSNADNKIVLWSSSNDSVATVDGIGNVEGKNEGSAIITASTKNGKIAICKVVVYKQNTQSQPFKSTPIVTTTKNISNTTILTNSVTYTGKAQTPNVTVKDGNTILKNGTDYIVNYTNNINAGIAKITVTGKGNYTGTVTANFTIKKATYDMKNVKFVDLSITYDGKAHSIIASGLPKGVKVSYSGNGKTTVGKYTVTAKFTGDIINYNAIQDKKAILNINAKEISKTTVSGIKDKTYTGKAITQSIVIKDGNTVLKNGTDYIIKYTNNINVGTAKITATGKGNYKGSASKTFKIISSGYEYKKIKSKSVKLPTGDKVYFLDTQYYVKKDNNVGVKNSDAIILESKGKYAMIDTARVDQSSKIIKYLKELNIKELEFILLTHAHDDHIGGYIEIIKNVKVKNVYLKQYEKYDDKDENVKKIKNTMKKIVTLSQNAKINIKYVNKKENQAIGLGNISMNLYNTSLNKIVDSINDENDNSIVVLAKIKGKKIYFAADIEAANKAISKKIGDVDIYKVSHHGYLYNNTAEVLKQLKPEYAIITSFKERTTDVVNKLKNVGTKDNNIYGTGSGIVILNINNSGKIYFKQM